MTIPLRSSSSVETPMPEENIFNFLMRRFRRDLERGIESALTCEIPVVILGTHTDYIDPETQLVSSRPVVDARTEEAIVPAVAITDIQIQENPTDRTLRKCTKRVKVVSDSGALVDATRVMNPPIMVDIVLGIRGFHQRQDRLQSLMLAIRRHFMRHPYLYVPNDTENRDGDHDELVDELAHRFTTGDDISADGMVFEQFVPFDIPFVSFRSSSSRDNLVVADTQVQISAVPFADDWVIGNFQDLNTIEIILYDKSDPEQTEKARITVTAEG